MGVLLYFAFGLLNIGLLFLINHICKLKIGIPLFPDEDNRVEIIMCMITYFISGIFGTGILFLIGIILFFMWKKYYRKK
jgi:hypothetical protein